MAGIPGEHNDPLIELVDVPVSEDQQADGALSSGGSGSSPSHMDAS